MSPQNMLVPSSELPLHGATIRSSEVVLISAVAENRVIGAYGVTPWQLPNDLRRFRSLTLGHSVIMGRRTRETSARPLRDRQNIVLSGCDDYKEDGVIVARSLREALEVATWPAPTFVIGGERLYAEAIGLASTLHITEVHAKIAGDVFFPVIDKSVWSRDNTQFGGAAGPHSPAFTFVTYRRRRAQSCQGLI